MNEKLIAETFKHIPTLETSRLCLRRMKPSDAEDVFDYASRPETSKYLLWYPHEDLSYTKKYLKYIDKRYSQGAFFDWAVVEKNSGKMIGTCGFSKIDVNHERGEVGYVLNPDFHRKGYAPEAASAVLRFGFEVLGLHRIEVRFMIENTASRKVAEKLGMSFEGEERESMLVKGRYRTIGISSILKNEFEKQ